MWRILGAARRRRCVARQDAGFAPDLRKNRWHRFWSSQTEKFLANGFGRVSLTNVRD